MNSVMLLFLAAFAFIAGCEAKSNSFSIDYDHNTFLLDGKPFRYISGSIHYFRVPRGLWHDRLSKLKAAGFNAVQFVIPWNMHQRTAEETYDFSDDLDVEEFVRIAKDLGLYVLLRPGPYICAEHNGGGLPWWLYQLHPDIKLRSSDMRFLNHTGIWWQELLGRLKPHMYSNGGNILMVQLENEFGSYGCDIQYLTFLRELAKSILGDDTVLYTTDGAGEGYLKCGKVPEVYATVDFGVDADPATAFSNQQLYEPRGPLVNSEFYPGWLDVWGSPHNKVDVNRTADSLNAYLKYQNASISIYMAHGGTSFGFEAGINHCEGDTICVEPTSYDYDAPISEAGDLTPKYYAIKEVISRYFPIQDIPVNASAPKGNYGKIVMSYYGNFFSGLNYVAMPPVQDTIPKTFEQLGQENGFVVYRHVLATNYTDPCLLSLDDGARDRASIFVNQEPVGILSRQENIKSIAMPALSSGDILDIVVENQGRIGYGSPNVDFKGIIGNVRLSGANVAEWTMYGYPLDKPKLLRKYGKSSQSMMASRDDYKSYMIGSYLKTKGQMSLWMGNFSLDPDCIDGPKDTFLKLSGWHKGVVFINDFNLGRYWPKMGPQVTMYVPRTLLKCTNNEIHVLELERPACFQVDAVPPELECEVELVDHHEIDGPVPAVAKKRTFLRKTSGKHGTFR